MKNQFQEYPYEFDGHNFSIEVVTPNNPIRGSLVFLAGGGWMDDNRRNFHVFADDLADNGIVVFLPHYRVYRLHGVYPQTCLKDTIAGLRIIPNLYKKLNLDINTMVWGGGSSGAHLMLCSALLEKYNPGYMPQRMFFFNPVCCPDSLKLWVKQECGADFVFEDMCPLHGIQVAGPPLLIMHGTEDEIAPYSDSINFAEKYHALGGKCEVIPFLGRKHGFHHKTVSEEDYCATLLIAKNFILDSNNSCLEVY